MEAACARALDLDVVSVTKIASMLQRATENTTPVLPAQRNAAVARFARDPAEFTTGPHTGLATALTLIPGGAPATTPELETTP